MTETTDPNVTADHLRAAADQTDDAWARDLRERVAPQLASLELGERLGQGGMGVVFRARQVDLDRDVAVKVIAPPPGDRAEWSERFEREARALTALEHPGIVAIHGFGEADDVAWIVMELVDGASLRALMDADALTPDEALSIAPQLCAALEYAHERGIVHRDVKPENVLVDGTGRVKLVDFGIAKLAGDDAETRLTRTHQAMGTLRYMAPEQLDAPQSVDHRADIYALGVLLYEMLTGVVPQGVIAPPSKRVEVDVRIDEVVLRSLEREPEQRYQRVADLAERVEAIRKGDAPRQHDEPTMDQVRAEFLAGVRNDAALVFAFLLVATLIGPRTASEFDAVEPFALLGAAFLVLLSLPLAFAFVRGPRLGTVPTSAVRFITPFLMLGAAMLFARSFDPNEVEPDGWMIRRLSILSEATLFFMIAPFLTAALGTRVARRLRWGPWMQGTIRWAGVGLCAFGAVNSSPAWTDPFLWGQSAFLLLFLIVGIYAAFPRDRGRTSLGHHRRAIVFAAAGLVAMMISTGVSIAMRLFFEVVVVESWHRSIAYMAALALAALGGFAGIGSPRDAPDPPRRGAR